MAKKRKSTQVKAESPLTPISEDGDHTSVVNLLILIPKNAF